MTTLSRRLAVLEEKNPVQFVVPEIGASVGSIDAAQALWIELMVADESEWRSAAVQKFDAQEFVAFTATPGFRGFLDALSMEAMRRFEQLLEDSAPEKKETP